MKILICPECGAKHLNEGGYIVMVNGRFEFLCTLCENKTLTELRNLKG